MFGETVAVLFRGQGFEEGVILGACYSPETPDPAQDPHMDYRRYEDGTELWYDRKAHKLVGKIKGDVELEVDKNIKAVVEQNVELEVKGNIAANVLGKVEIVAMGQISLKSLTNVTLAAPTVTIAGYLLWSAFGGGIGKGVLHGHLIVREGGIDVPDNSITAGLDMLAGQNVLAGSDVLASEVSLRKHIHEGVMPGGGTSQ